MKPKMIFDEKRGVYQFGDDYIEKYVDAHEKDSHWNRTLLTLFMETIIFSIDTAIEAYKTYPGSAYLLLAGLHEINDCCRKKQDNLRDISSKFNHKFFNMGKGSHSLELIPLASGMTPLLQLCVEIFHKFSYEKVQGTYWISAEKKEEVHEIIDAHLKEAMECIQNSPAYQHAERDKHLYCAPWISEPKEPDLKRQTSHFFAPPSTAKRQKVTTSSSSETDANKLPEQKPGVTYHTQ